MNRDLDHDGREAASPANETQPRSERTVASPQVAERFAQQRSSDHDRRPIEIRTRGSSYRLSASHLAMMYDVGRFRTIALQDLEAHRGSHARRDLSGLKDQGLIQIKSIRTNIQHRPLHIAVLSKRGKRLLTELDLHPEQALFSGFVKAREVAHDAAIYRMFLADRERIEREGGSVRRVILDFELKALVYKPLATFRAHKPNAPASAYERVQHEVAGRFGLKVVAGKIPLPDLRIEYENAQGVVSHVDLELATHHYHAGAMAAKAQAGFQFYAADGSADRLTRVLEERDLTVAILSL